jgi:DNA-binding NarL/FixJ family response regulator
MAYNIAIIEDNLEIRQNLSDYFAKSTKVQCVMAVDTVEKFIKFHRDFLGIKLVLLDVRLYELSGIDGIPLILEREPDAEIIMYTIHDDYDTIFQALCKGATGYLLKETTPEALEEKIVTVLENGGAVLSPMVAKRILGYFNQRTPQAPATPKKALLTEKEKVVVTFLKDGYSYEEISVFLKIGVNGVRYYVKTIYRKMQIKNRGELLRNTRI